MKKKIITVCLVIALVATAVVGASLAYFTDTDTETNVFTVGKVDITLNDEFDQNSPLFPAVVEDDGTVKNGVDKVVSVTNNEEDAYVRVHIAVPSAMDELIYLAYEGAEGWDWNKDTRVEDYTTTIDGVEYVVVCLTYSDILEEGDVTTDVLKWVVMDPEATNEDVEAFNESGLNIIVIAEGAQAAGFDNAYDALEAAFGTPSATANPWNQYGAAQGEE